MDAWCIRTSSQRLLKRSLGDFLVFLCALSSQRLSSQRNYRQTRVVLHRSDNGLSVNLNSRTFSNIFAENIDPLFTLTCLTRTMCTAANFSDTTPVARGALFSVEFYAQQIGCDVPSKYGVGVKLEYFD